MRAISGTRVAPSSIGSRATTGGSSSANPGFRSVVISPSPATPPAGITSNRHGSSPSDGST